MSVTCRVVTSFRSSDRTPESILWSGILEWVHTDRQNANGYPERVLRLQTSLMRGRNGPFLAMPYQQRIDPDTGRMVAVKDANGRYRNVVDIGPDFQRTGIQVIQQVLAGGDSGPTRVSTSGDVRAAAQQTLLEEGGDPGDMREDARKAFVEEPPLSFGNDTTPDDPFGDLDF